MRFLRQLAELRSRYVTACGDDVRQVILISGGIEGCERKPDLIPHWRIEGGLTETPAYDDGFGSGYVDDACDSEDILA